MYSAAAVHTEPLAAADHPSPCYVSPGQPHRAIKSIQKKRCSTPGRCGPGSSCHGHNQAVKQIYAQEYDLKPADSKGMHSQACFAAQPATVPQPSGYSGKEDGRNRPACMFKSCGIVHFLCVTTRTPQHPKHVYVCAFEASTTAMCGMPPA